MKILLLAFTILIFSSCRKDFSTEANLKNVKVDIITQSATADYYVVNGADTAVCCEECRVAEHDLAEFTKHGFAKVNCTYDSRCIDGLLFRCMAIISVLFYALHLAHKTIDNYEKNYKQKQVI